jgi:hypothetical protein
MSTMSELLAEVADEARNYDATDHAVRAMRRQRRFRRIAPMAVAVVVLLGLGVTAAIFRTTDGESLPTGPSIVDGLPRSLGAGPTQPFPEDRAVGPAALVYRSLPSLDGVLVTTDGARYRLPDQAIGLSPDGRWLVTLRGGQALVRDLTGTTTWTLTSEPKAPYRLVWAKDGTRLAEHGDEEPATVLDLATGAVHQVSVGSSPQARLCGLQDTGALVVCARAETGTVLELSTVDSVTGEQLSHRSVDVPGVLSENERKGLNIMGYDYIQPMAGATTLLLPIYRYLDAGIALPSDALVLRVDTATIVQRLTMPVNREPAAVPDPASNGVRYMYQEVWLTRPSPSGGLLLIHATAVDGKPTQQPVIRELQYLDPATGERTTVTTISASLAVGDVVLRAT